MQELLKKPRKYYLQFQTTIAKGGNRGNKFKIPGSIQVYEDAIFASYEYGLDNNISADNLYVPIQYSLDDKKSIFVPIQSHGIFIKYGYGTTVNKIETLLIHLTQKTKFNSFEVTHNRYKVKFDDLSTPVLRILLDELFNSPNKRINYSWAEPLQDLLIKRSLEKNKPKNKRVKNNTPKLNRGVVGAKSTTGHIPLEPRGGRYQQPLSEVALAKEIKSHIQQQIDKEYSVWSWGTPGQKPDPIPVTDPNTPVGTEADGHVIAKTPRFIYKRTLNGQIVCIEEETLKGVKQTSPEDDLPVSLPSNAELSELIKGKTFLNSGLVVDGSNKTGTDFGEDDWDLSVNDDNSF